MKAFVTSIGEPTTRLCCDQLRLLGFDVVLLKDDQSLWWKLREIYNQADDDFLRVDADVVPNRNARSFWEGYTKDVWWVQARTFGWYSQDVIYSGIQFIRKEALPALRANIDRFEKAERPESQMFRLDEFHAPRRCVSSEVVAGLHGYGQGDIERVKAVKQRRRQYDNYAWELVERLAEL